MVTPERRTNSTGVSFSKEPFDEEEFRQRLRRRFFANKCIPLTRQDTTAVLYECGKQPQPPSVDQRLPYSP